MQVPELKHLIPDSAWNKQLRSAASL